MAAKTGKKGGRKNPTKHSAPGDKRRAWKKIGPVRHRFAVDCSGPAGDKIFDAEAFKKFLAQRIKVAGLSKPPGEANLEKHGLRIYLDPPAQIVVCAEGTHLSKRSLKYYTRKFLKANELRDWLRVVRKDQFSYELRYFNISSQEDEEENQEETTT
eukprot:TRINITY_DN81209_c0_g1_i1.p1 TRINITY_DN81209_c0_g1~~TRINITY_DN81209_c0_g1_i1.p1  ORF type:complete len:156 (-),score=26.09 TRINITY_DN81209_c0_g1_i1:325-792(-)